jgi:hypothetical protein
MTTGTTQTHTAQNYNAKTHAAKSNGVDSGNDNPETAYAKLIGRAILGDPDAAEGLTDYFDTQYDVFADWFEGEQDMMTCDAIFAALGPEDSEIIDMVIRKAESSVGGLRYKTIGKAVATTLLNGMPPTCDQLSTSQRNYLELALESGVSVTYCTGLNEKGLRRYLSGELDLQF